MYKKLITLLVITLCAFTVFAKGTKEGEPIIWPSDEAKAVVEEVKPAEIQPAKQIVTQLSDRSYCISEFNLVNSFLVIGGDKAALIDTCCGLGNIREVAEELTDKPIIVLLTHGHPDHTGGIYHFNTDGTPIYMNDKDLSVAATQMTNAFRAAYVNSRGPVRYPGHQEEMLLTIPETEPDCSFTSIPVNDGDIIDLGGGVKLEVFATPGHTEGSVCYLDREDRILYSGDTLNRSIILKRQPNNGTALIEVLNGTMKKLNDRIDEFDRLAPGHDAYVAPNTVVGDYYYLTSGLLDGSLVGQYEELDFRAGDVVRHGGAELWYQCDK
jgi:Zn-dependent hydrolases, including glyoxylases